MKITYLKDEYILEDISILDLQSSRFCVVDFEGTGINVRTEYITQIGAVIFEGQSDRYQSFCSLVKSPKAIPPNIEELTGIKNEENIGAPSFPEVYEQFLDFINGTILVTQAGYEYDLPLLERHCKEHHLLMCSNQVIDTKALFTYIHPDINEIISTNFLLNYYGIYSGDLKRHHALDDCILISRIFRKILDEYNEMGIKDFIIGEKLKVKRFSIPGMYLEEGCEVCSIK